MKVPHEHKTKTHELQLVGFLVYLFQMVRPDHLGLLPFILILVVKPFAYVVGDYTCHNGKDERNENIHHEHLLPVASIGAVTNTL